MKRLMALLAVGIMSIGLVACGSGDSSDSTESETPKQVEAETTKEAEFVEKIGEGNFYVSTPSGTSENDNAPFFYAGKDEIIIQLGFYYEGLDGSKLSYIYIDDKLLEKEQLGDGATSLNLEKDNLKAGQHIVTVKQYDNNEESGNVTFQQSARYEIKEK